MSDVLRLEAWNIVIAPATGYELHRNYFKLSTRLTRHRPPQLPTEADKKPTLSLGSSILRTFEVHCAFDVRGIHRTPSAMLPTTSKSPEFITKLTHPPIQQTSKTVHALHPHRNVSISRLFFREEQVVHGETERVFTRHKVQVDHLATPIVDSLCSHFTMQSQGWARFAF